MNSLKRRVNCPVTFIQRMIRGPQDPKIVMTMRNYLQKMEQYTLVTSEGSTGFREYPVTGEIH